MCFKGTFFDKEVIHPEPLWLRCYNIFSEILDENGIEYLANKELNNHDGYYIY